MLKAWNTEHPGSAASVHANDARAALIRLESLVREATAAPQQHLIAEAVNVVVFVDGETTIPADRKVREVVVVMGSPRWYITRPESRSTEIPRR
jgi:type IV secretion system protein VirB11